MKKIRTERQRQVVAHSANALRLFEEAKRLQRQLAALPFTQRQSALSQANSLEREAIGEARKSIALENQSLEGSQPDNYAVPTNNS